MLSCGDPSSLQPSQTSALTEGTWEGCSVLCVDASRRPGVRAGGLAASSGLWVVPGWTWGQGALSRRASFLPFHNQRHWTFVLLGAATGKTEALYSSSDKSPHSWVFAIPGKQTQCWDYVHKRTPPKCVKVSSLRVKVNKVFSRYSIPHSKVLSPVKVHKFQQLLFPLQHKVPSKIL